LTPPRARSLRELRKAAALVGELVIFLNMLLTAHGWWRWLVLAPAIVAVLAVGGARIYRAAHHPSDVLGGALLGIVWLLVAARAVSPGPLRPAGAAGRRPTRTGTG
jgi:membrane-associated phospholipid phosphatase